VTSAVTVTPNQLHQHSRITRIDHGVSQAPAADGEFLGSLPHTLKPTAASRVLAPVSCDVREAGVTKGAQGGK